MRKQHHVITGRERVLCALAHREPDRVPRDLGGTESSGMTALALARLQSRLNIRGELRIFEPYQYVAHIGEELRTQLKIDTVNLTPEPRQWVGKINPWKRAVLLPEKWNEETEPDGATVVRNHSGQVTARRPSGSYYFDPVNPPLAHVTDAAEVAQHLPTIHGFDYPSFADESYEAMRQRAQWMSARGECVVFNLCCHILAAGQLLRGYETFMIDLLTDRVLVERLFDALVEGYCRRVDALAPHLKDVVDVVLLNDDLGTQTGPMLSPAVYRLLVKPYQARLFAYVKEAFGKPLLFHSCGAVREFIPDLIEVGVNALNPVQVSALGMEVAALKRDFGRDITFWGGGIDTQSVLNRKTPSEVADAVRRTVDILAPGGGFVFCQVHNIQPDVPTRNVVAMYKALDDIALGPLGHVKSRIAHTKEEIAND